MTEYFDYGKIVEDRCGLVGPMSNLCEACLQHSDFEFLELRSVNTPCDTIVLECCNAEVPLGNNVGIRNRERLAITYDPSEKNPWKIRPLRKDFPVTLHQNVVPEGEPTSLCLYFEPWSAVERTWTPQRFLERILWWLKEVAQETIHKADQPLEPLYFDSPIKLVLPVDFEEKIKNNSLAMYLTSVNTPSKDKVILRGDFGNVALRKNSNIPSFECIVIAPPPVLHARVNRFPKTLGKLHEDLLARGSELFNCLVNEFRRGVSSSGILPRTGDVKTLIIISTEIKRAEDLRPEKTQTIGFEVLDTSYAMLGEAFGILIKDPKSGGQKFYIKTLIGGTAPLEEKWKELKILPIEIIPSITRQDARKFSGVQDERADFKGILAGLGALGSTLADIWTKEGFGEWTFIDDDYIRPHNVTRHLCRDIQVGQAKVDAVDCLVSANYNPGHVVNKKIIAQANDYSNAAILAALSESDLFIDATTTLEVPRDLSLRDSCPRAASIFLTPSGTGSVLLLEDKERNIRLDSLEAQYYKAIIENEWGQNHLSGHKGDIWIGAGCRDISLVMPQELILLHAATLARRVRLKVADSDAHIDIWEMDDDSGELKNYSIPVLPTAYRQIRDWTIKWNTGFCRKIKTFRQKQLPNETGGIIVGYIDHKQKSINIVDAMKAPKDSKASASSFERGVEGLLVKLDEIKRRTANLVDYIGEWHSHPRRSSTSPSSLDIALLAYLAAELAKEGNPGLMATVGDDDIRMTLGEKW